jgi:UDP-GlcNAc:undecaprenyl-phosphate GlcNAc-1-phosphate transferase
MLTTLALAALSFTLSFLLTPVSRKLALRYDWVDQPDKSRKVHRVPIPRIGGVPIVLAYFGSFGVLVVFPVDGTFAVQQSFELVWKVLPPAVLVFFAGLLDDLIGLKPWQKLLAETIAAAAVCFTGIQIHGVAGYTFNGLLGVPLTIGWLIACTNAFNLIDGLDGLASGLGFLASLTTVVAGLLHGDAGLVVATAPLSGVLLGFLLFNFNPASIFLGDGGSLSVGFLLACYSVVWCQKSVTALGIMAPLMALSIPLLDTALSVARRFLRSQPIFGADRGHIHHKLLDRGLTPCRAALLLYGANGLAAALSILVESTVQQDIARLSIVVFCVITWAGIRHLKYPEFGVAAHLLRQNSLGSLVASHICLRGHQESLRAAGSVEECWRAIRMIGHDFGFSYVELRLGNHSYEDQLEQGEKDYWLLHIPFSGSEYVRFMCQFELSRSPVFVAHLVDMLHRTLSVKSAEFRVALPIMQKAAATANAAS